ncbi:phosphorylated adapter RNA export protein-like [Teleopsis dalmanni]|uniref:phosphorylated adapter RNA export protein-like n=1 Tax=Teleopsis dalmanni TaxID=139649 RepID=UPI0018CDC183|nr:phosphorylated adapter RNA export protein-like [Teleopsis dalmanni]
MSDMEPINTEISTDAKLQSMNASDNVLKLCESDSKKMQPEKEVNANKLKPIGSSDELYALLQRPPNNESQVSFEDGELLDPVSSDDYEPLQRQNTEFSKNNFLSDSENSSHSENSSDSEDSSDNSFGTLKPLRVEQKVQKKRPIMVRVNTPNETGTKFKKNNIWVETLEKETLNETMRSINVSSDLFNKRSVESYQYPRNLKRKGRFSRNDFHCHRFNSKQRRTASNKKQDDAFDFSRLKNKPPHNKKRYIRDLKDVEGRDVADIAKEMAKNLHERKSHLIERILTILGLEIPMDIYKKTQAIEEKDGMMILNGKRRRTSGGVYFYLVKGDERISEKIRDEIFEVDKQRNSKCTESMNNEPRDRKVEECLGDHENFLQGSDLSTENKSGDLSNPPPLQFGDDNSSNVVPEVNLKSSVPSPVTQNNVSTEPEYLDNIDFNYKMDLS